MNYFKIGKKLQLARERKGLTYDQIFEITKIQISVLKDIEEGKSNVFPVFLKGFIKTYAQTLGLNWSVLFQSEIKNPVVSKKTPVVQKVKHKLFIHNWKHIFIFILVALGFASIVYMTGSISVRDKDLNTHLDHSDFKINTSPSFVNNLNTMNLNLITNASLFDQIKQGDFKKEILIQSPKALDVYFKLDKSSTLTKKLIPLKWFSMKAKSSIYLRFDDVHKGIQVFYNGNKIDFTNKMHFFEKRF